MRSGSWSQDPGVRPCAGRLPSEAPPLRAGQPRKRSRILVNTRTCLGSSTVLRARTCNGSANRSVRPSAGIATAAFPRVLGIVALAFLIACNNPFATRTPAPPSEGKIDLLEPDSATNVLQNFGDIFKKVNDERYEEGYTELFDEDFEFLPDESDRETFNVVFSTQWLKDREERFAKKLFEKGFLSGVSIDLWSFTPLQASEDEEQYEYQYSVTIGYVDPRFTEDDFYPKSLRGTSLLFLSEKDGTWAIYRWEDQRTDEEAASWGGLRAKFSS